MIFKGLDIYFYKSMLLTFTIVAYSDWSPNTYQARALLWLSRRFRYGWGLTTPVGVWDLRSSRLTTKMRSVMLAMLRVLTVAAGAAKWETLSGLQIRGSKFRSSSSKFRELELQNFRARSRLYRSQILQVNTCWKALPEIYTMHSFAPFSNSDSSRRQRRGRVVVHWSTNSQFIGKH